MTKKGRTAKISIDVRERAVNIIKINGSGVIVKAGSAELPAMNPDLPDMKYAIALSSAIMQAAKAAKIRERGNCVMVVGGPQFITRSFVWPEMPPDSLQLNAESEIMRYLPLEIEKFIVGYRVLRHTVTNRDGNKSAQLDALVAAITKDMSAALLSAAKMAGFSPTRIDIRENAREKLVRTPRLWQNQDHLFAPNGSFAILNATDSLIDMTVFVNGVFYASRYFGSDVNAASYSNDDPAESDYVSHGDSKSNDSGIVTEIASTIDYIQYRERGLKVGNILLFGDEKTSKKLIPNLLDQLEIPVIQVSDQLAPIVKRSKKVKINALLFLDAVGAAIAPPVSAYADLNLKPKKQKHHIFRRFIWPVFCLALMVGTLLAAGLYLPYDRILALQSQEQKIAEELESYTVLGDVEELQREVSFMTKMAEEINGFHTPYNAPELMRVIYGALPPNTEINSLSIDEGRVSLAGTTDTLDRGAGFITALRSSALFAGASASTASYSTENGSDVEFEITLIFPYKEDEE